jgi:branched-chain amino acid transport system substrate-binding protein
LERKLQEVLQMKRTILVIAVIIVISLGSVIFVSKTRKLPEEVKIGAVLILTGPDAKAGQSARQGIQMAVEEINKEGGINGKKLVVIYEDDQGEPQKSVSAVLKLINVDKVPAIIGPMWSTNVLAVAPIAEKHKVVILSPTASAPKITKAGDYIFRNTYSDTFEGTKDAEFAYKVLGYRKAGIIHVNLDAGIEIADVFSKKFKELGGQVVLRESYDPKTTDFRTLLTKFKNQPIDFIYLMGYNEMGQLVKQAREIGLKTPFLSTIMFEISDVLKVAGNAAQGVVYSYPSYDTEKGGEIVKKFAREYKKRYGVLPDPEAAFSYDAAKILCYVMRKFGISSEKIKDGLYNVKGYMGVTGLTSFDRNGDVVKPIGFKKVVGGKYTWLVFQY